MTQLLAPKQVAERLGLTQHHVYKMLKTGKIPYVVLSARCYRVSEADLETYIAERRVA